MNISPQTKSLVLLAIGVIATGAISYRLLDTPVEPQPVAKHDVTDGKSTVDSESLADNQILHSDVVFSTAPTRTAITEDETVLEETDITQNNFAEMQQPDSETLRTARQQQLQYLKEVHPDNLMIPTEKSEQEVEQMLADMELHRSLQQHIDDNTATAEERQAYVALHRQKLEEERELIYLCEDVATNSLESEAIQQAQLCTHVAVAKEQRLQIIEATLLELEALLTANVE